MAGNSDELNRAYLDSYAIEWRFLTEKPFNGASAVCELFGKKLSTPIMCGGMAHYDAMHPDGAAYFARCAQSAQTAMFTGMATNAELENVIATGVPCGRIIKPFEDRDYVISLMQHDEKAGAWAVSMDIDHAYKKDGSLCIFEGRPLATQTRVALEEYQKSISIPFLPKGVLSVHDAVICAEAGCKGIIISAHQNMFPWTYPPIKVLQEIRRELGRSVTVFVDSNLETGYDVFKALAFGADGVFVARPLRRLFIEKGPEAVAEHIKSMTGELTACMARTGAADIRSINPGCIRELSQI